MAPAGVPGDAPEGGGDELPLPEITGRSHRDVVSPPQHEGDAMLIIAFLAGCGGGLGTPGSTPADRPHTIRESDDGESGWHAEGYKTPYLCLDASGNTTTCPDDAWPDRSELSCDASGCHGTYDYDPATPQDGRALDGHMGPGCFECHEQEWNDKKTADGVGSGGDEDDD